MVQWFHIKHASLAISEEQIAGNHYLRSLTNSLEFFSDSENHAAANLASAVADLTLVSTDAGLVLDWTQAKGKPLSYNLDFSKQAEQLRSFPAPKQGAFNQALGKKTHKIIDATGGWGSDALLMCLQGYEVVVIERLPLMAAILADAFERLGKSRWAQDNNVMVPKVISGNALDVLQTGNLDADCVYLDPMFPPKRKKSAATNKQMQLLQWLAGPDADASDVASAAVSNFPRLAVKRPSYAEPLIKPVQAQFTSKLVHYDVYLNS